MVSTHAANENRVLSGPVAKPGPEPESWDPDPDPDPDLLVI